MSRAQMRSGGIVIAATAICALAYVILRRAGIPGESARYVAEGYGGYRPDAQMGTSGRPSPHRIDPAGPPVIDPLAPAVSSYNHGLYREAETQAAKIIAKNEAARSAEAGAKPAAHRDSTPYPEQSVKARLLMAYAAARRKDFAIARERFDLARVQAASLTSASGIEGGVRSGPAAAHLSAGNGAKISAALAQGQNEARMEDEAAYQRAVCTSALGDKQAAEREYVEFMRKYPDSPLLQAALKRIARFHGGDVPKAAEAVWREAMNTAQKHVQARQREESMCGPACLAEIIRRGDAGTAGRGDTERQIHALAGEMGTTYQGTSLKALAEAARKRGFSAEGLRLTAKGLEKQPLPVIALVTPEHYVLIEKLTPDRVTVWDPDGNGIGNARSRSYRRDEWKRVWSGIALAVGQKRSASAH